MIVRRAFVALIEAYRVVVSPFLPPACRYYPTCSQYAKEAVLKHGVLRGSFLAVRRLLRCSPLHSGGVDFVP